MLFQFQELPCLLGNRWESVKPVLRPIPSGPPRAEKPSSWQPLAVLRVSQAWLSPTMAPSCCRWGPELREVKELPVEWQGWS